MLPALRRRQGEYSAHSQHGTMAFIKHLHKDPEAEWKLVPAASSRSPQDKSQRAEALVAAFIISKLQSYHIVVPTYLLIVCARSFGSGKYLIATVNRSSALFYTGCTRAGPCLGASKPVGRLMGTADVVVVEENTWAASWEGQSKPYRAHISYVVTGPAHQISRRWPSA